MARHPRHPAPVDDASAPVDLVVNLYPDQAGEPRSWSSADLGSPSVHFRRGPGGWVAHLERHAVLRAPSPEALAADVYGEYGVVAVLHQEPLAVA